MPFDDPRDFLEHLEERKELLRITAEVDPKFDIGAYIRKTSDQQGPALLFENVKGSGMVVAGGIFSPRGPASSWPWRPTKRRFTSASTTG